MIMSLIAANSSRLMVVNHKVKKKQHACASSGLCDHYSELFTQMAALKFENPYTGKLPFDATLSFFWINQIINK